MGSKSSTPQSPDSDDSSPGSQSYSRAERVLDYGEHSLQQQQARHERSFMERAESSLQGLMMYTGGNSPVVDIRRSDIAGEHQSSLGSSRPGSLPPSGPNRSHSVGGQASPGESAGSSIGSNTGLSHFLSNFNLWRSAAGPSSSSSDRQRAQSLSHMALDPTAQGAGDSSSRPSSSRQQYHHQQQQHSSDLSDDLSSLSLSNPRAALNRLLSSRNGSSGGGASASPSGAVANLPTDRRDSNGTNSSAAFSVRDLTFAAAQEFLAEATMNGLGLNRVYVTHSLPSHMWAVNGNHHPFRYDTIRLFTTPIQFFAHPSLSHVLSIEVNIQV